MVVEVFSECCGNYGLVFLYFSYLILIMFLIILISFKIFIYYFKLLIKILYEN